MRHPLSMIEIASEFGAQRNLPTNLYATRGFSERGHMSRDRRRVCLQDGRKLDLNKLIRDGTVRPGIRTGPFLIQWTNSYTGERVASGFLTASFCGLDEGWLRFQSSRVDQRIRLVACPRRYGGKQWYFICPVTKRRASVLWMPPGARQFCSRQAWGKRVVAYRSQFLSVYDRGHAGKAKIKARLIGDLDPDAWDLPPKPKWMRWRTYNRLAERFDAYDDMTYPDDLPAKLMRLLK
jgi:hypothetical protein